MKKIICKMMIVCMALSSCNKNSKNEKLYEAFGVVRENSAGKFHVRTDKSNFIVLNNEKLTEKDRNARVWLLFSTESDPEADTVNADVYQFLRITGIDKKTGDIDSLKNDPIVRMNTAWIAQNYLTLSLDLYSYSPQSLDAHKYVLYSDAMAAAGDTVHLELRHDKNGDTGDRRYTKLLAIETEKIFDSSKVPSLIAIRYLKSNSSISDTAYVKIE